MTTNENAEHKPLHPAPPPRARRRFCRCCAITSAIVLLLIVIVLILFFTLFKPKDPTTTLLSTTVYGVSPSVSLPTIQFQLNVSLDLLFHVRNPNRASFRHRPGESLVLYRGNQVGDVDISPGKIPATGSEQIPCRVTVEADKFGSDSTRFLADVVSGEVEFEARTRIPGKVTVLGFIKKNVVAVVDCLVMVQFPGLTVGRQECQHKIKM